MPEDQQERTERGTQKRRDDAKRKGGSPKSREITSAALLIASALFLTFLSPVLISRMKEIMILFWSGFFSVPMTLVSFIQVMNSAILASLSIIGPTMLFFGIVGVISMIGQTGLVMNQTPFSPNWSRINPFSGFKRILSVQSSVELIKGIVKLALVAWIAYRLIEKDIPTLIEAVDSAPDRLVLLMLNFITRLILWVGIAMAFLGAVDYLFQLWSFERSIRMTHREIKEEGKQTDGNPQVRSRIRNIQRSLAKKRMMTEVPKADVVVTNPSHLAVALRYRSETMAAPVVVAKGSGLIAEKIREIARKNQIPILENKPLARTLFKEVEIGAPIPSDLYKAVAEILAYVYKLRGKSINNVRR